MQLWCHFARRFFHDFRIPRPPPPGTSRAGWTLSEWLCRGSDRSCRTIFFLPRSEWPPTLSRARVQLEKSFDGDYDHLARSREWALSVEGGE